jgi:hypothetical protein
MNEDSLDFDLEDLPPPPTLRRQHAMGPDDSSQIFFDTKTKEIVSGNPDLTHSSNKNLVRAITWKLGQCNPNAFFFPKDDRDDQDPGMNAIPMIECKA